MRVELTQNSYLTKEIYTWHITSQRLNVLDKLLQEQRETDTTEQDLKILLKQ